MSENPAAGRRRSYQTTLLIVAVAAAGLNLRAAITSLPPLFPVLGTRLHLSSAALSLLATTPVICFGVVSAFAPRLNRLWGEERVLLIALAVLTAGLLLRGIAPSTLLFPGTALAASAIAILNVLLSSLVKRRWPERAGLLIGIYLTALSVGAILSSLLSVPLYQVSGGSIPLALGVWAGPAALAVLLWLPQLRYHTSGRTRPAGGSVPDGGPPPPAGLTPTPRKLYRYALTWQVTAFMGLQSLLYYAALSWLPTIFQDRGSSPVEGGNLLALMGVGNLTTSLIVPVLAHRSPGQRALVIPSLIGTAVGPGRMLVGVAGPGPAGGPGARCQPGVLPRPGHFLHDGTGPGCCCGGLAVGLRPVGRLPGRKCRAARARAAAHGHRQLGHPDDPAAHPVRLRACRRGPRRAAAGPPGARGPVRAGRRRGPEQLTESDARVGYRARGTSYLRIVAVDSARPFPPGPHSTRGAPVTLLECINGP